ncbi:MAG: hypothetical protein ABFD58_11735 [Anaerolineaceae bacterium]
MPTEQPPAPLEHEYYVYDGDGNLVKSIVNYAATLFYGEVLPEAGHREGDNLQEDVYGGQQTDRGSYH